MLREHAPLIAVSTVIAIMFYLVFRDVRGLRAAVTALHVASGPPAVLPPRKAVAEVDAAADEGAGDEGDEELVEPPPAKPARRK